MQWLSITIITMERKFESVDYDKGYLEALACMIQENPDCIFHLPMGADIATWDAVKVTKEDH